MSEFLHVSQMFETIFTFSSSLLVISAVLIVKHNLWSVVLQNNLKDKEQEQKWYEEESIRRGIGQTSTAQDNSNPDSVVRNVTAELNPDGNHDNNPPVEEQQPPAIKLQDLSQIQIRALTFSKVVNNIFDEYFPVIMCALVVGILVQSTYILSAMSFFCYLFFNLVFNYANLLQKLVVKVSNPLIPRLVSLVAGIFMIMYFIGVLARVEFNSTLTYRT